MVSLYDNLLQLLDKRIDEPFVREFIAGVGEIADIRDDFSFNVESNEIRFRRSGFAISVTNGLIWDVFLYARVPECWKEVHGEFLTFSGEWPSGIKPGDDRSAVAVKLGRSVAESYFDQAPCITPEFSEEEHGASMLLALEGRYTPAVDRIRAYEIARNEMPDSTVTDVYNVENYEMHFTFLLEDQKLIGVELSTNDAKMRISEFLWSAGDA